MAERSEAPDSRNSSVEKSGTRVCAWVRIPLLSENVLNTTRQSLQLTNSVILERQFKMTVQSQRKEKTRNVLGRLIAEQFESAQKKDTRRRHVKHDSTRGFKCKSFQIDDTNRLADYISELKRSLKWNDTDQKKICRRKPGRMVGALRRQTEESPQSRILVHECVRGFESHSCQKTFWTRWSRAFSWQILSYWNVNSRRESKAKENKRLATSLGRW